MSQVTTKVENGVLLIAVPLTGKGLTSSLKSMMLGTTNGFQDVGELQGVQLSVNVIREATDGEVLAGATADDVRAAIEADKGKTGKKAEARRGRFIRLLDQMQDNKPAQEVPRSGVVMGGSLAKPAKVA